MDCGVQEVVTTRSDFIMRDVAFCLATVTSNFLHFPSFLIMVGREKGVGSFALVSCLLIYPFSQLLIKLNEDRYLSFRLVRNGRN